MTDQDIFVQRYNFAKIGRYDKQCSGDVIRIVEDHIKIGQRKSLVYAMFVDGQCMYVGKSIQGYKRPLGYHKNNVMVAVRDGIVHSTSQGKVVEVFAKEDNLSAEYLDLTLNLVEAVEQGLITKFNPGWNNFIQK